MAELVLPNTFSNLPQQYVYNKRIDSLFFVKASANLAVLTVRYLKDNFGLSDEKARELLNNPLVATGCVISETQSHYRILTCAHIFEAFYSAERTASINQLHAWFDVEVVCQHYEDYMSKNVPDLYTAPGDPRIYSPAKILKFDQSKDLMLLKVSRNHVYGTNNETRCQIRHKPIPIAQPQTIPQYLSDVTMVCWPPCRRDCPVIGHLVSPSRVYGQISGDLSKGYNMHLLELDITGGDGCSGAPILNHTASIVALYHGRLNSVGYGISADDIRQFCE